MSQLKIRHGRLGAGFLLVLAASLSLADSTNAVSSLINEGKENSQVMKHLRELTNIGPRLTGSPNLYRAQLWAVAKFKSFGIDNARLEQWGEVPVGFERGPSYGKMIKPFDVEFDISTPNWTIGTKGPKRAHAVLAPQTLEELEKMKSRLKGAWVVMPASQSGGGRRREETAEDKALREAIDKAGIAGRVNGSRDERVYGFGSFRDKTYASRNEGTPSVYVRKSDHDRIVRNIEYGRETVLEFDLDNRWLKGPVPQYNVIADIPGTDPSGEMVIVCGHLDSWNSPGSQGACDNGTGSVTALEAARILMASGQKPKRTIRFILWSGEEQGLLGSRAYVEKHKADMAKISVVLNDDGGSGYHGGYSVTPNMAEAFKAAVAPIEAAFPTLPIEIEVAEKIRQSMSSDHAPFFRAGVPAFFTKEKGEKADYGHVWHTQYDRYEFAVPEYLIQSATNHAAVAWHFANAASLLPRVEVVETAGRGGGAFDEHDHDHDHDHDH